MEIWRPIPGYENYSVSNQGRVRNGAGHIMHVYPLRKGYLYLSLPTIGGHKQFSVARLVASAFIPNPDGKPQVNHKDGCSTNNLDSNLEWVTCSEQLQHAYDTGLRRKLSGEDHGRAKLTWEQVRQIRESVGVSSAQLAKQFGISYPQVRTILRRKAWTCEPQPVLTYG